VTNRRPHAITVASLLLQFMGIISVAATSYFLVVLVRSHSFPTFLGVQMFMSGRFEGVALWRMIGLASLVLIILGLQIVAGSWLWKSQRRGGYLTLLLLGLSLVVTVALGAPGMLISTLPATVLVLSRWGSLR